MLDEIGSSGWEAALVSRTKEALAQFRANPAPKVPAMLSRGQLARMIDHTLLSADATPDQVDRLCSEAVQYGFASVCVNPFNVLQCASLLEGAEVTVCSVSGFPLGASLAEVKAFEAMRAISDGAREIDMVINIGALRAGNYRAVRDDIAAVAEVCHNHKALLKVILETCLLDDEQKVTGCLLAMEAGADFVKTSTGLSTGGATTADVALMRSVVGPNVGVKAAGGIRDFQSAVAMIEAGANRIGASAGIRILEGAPPA